MVGTLVKVKETIHGVCLRKNISTVLPELSPLFAVQVSDPAGQRRRVRRAGQRL